MATRYLIGSVLSVTTKGDLQGFTTIPARVPVGVDGQVLIADSTQPSGLRYGATPGGTPATTTTLGDVIVPTSGNLSVDGSGNISSGPNIPLLNAANTFTAQPQTLSAVPTATANRGVLDLGAGPFDGISAGKFAGSASGTELAINAGSGYTGNLIRAQTFGVDAFTLDYTGSMTIRIVSGGVWQFATPSGNGGLVAFSPAGNFRRDMQITDSIGFLLIPKGGAQPMVCLVAQTDGNGSDIQQWQTQGGATLAKVTSVGEISVAGLFENVVTKTANYTATTSDAIIIANAATLTITLTTAVGRSGRMFTVKNGPSGTSTTVSSGGGTIDGAATDTSLTTAFAAARYVSDGTNWFKI